MSRLLRCSSRPVGALVGLVLLCSHLLQADPPGPAPDHVTVRLRVVQAELARHDDLYFRQAAPEISDAEYDALKRELRTLRERYPAAAAGVAPSAGLGDDRTGTWPARAHRVPMQGLDKAYAMSDLAAFLARARAIAGGREPLWVLEPKYDGLAVSATYERGRLVRVVTRGNGREGDDVTANVLALTDLPRELRPESAAGAPGPECVEIRGEVYLTLAEFSRINAERSAAGAEAYAHPRNLAVGTLKTTDPAERAGRRLSVVFYGWGAWEPAESAPASQQAWLAQLAAWGLPIPEPVERAQGESAVRAAIGRWTDRRADLGFPADGIVLKVDDVRLRQALGEGPEAPRWALAWKFPPERAATRLRGITWQVGRTGVLTPVAELEPVAVGGALVSRASLHNREVIARHDYRPGDTVWVERAGEVIPVLAGVDFSRRPREAAGYVFPTACPSCERPVVVESAGGGLRCADRTCPAQVRRRLEHFASAGAVDLAGFGPAVIDALVRRGALTEPADFFRLADADLRAAAGSGGAERLRRSVARARQAEWWRFIHGFGWPEVGPAKARKLADRFASWDDLAAARGEDLVEAGLSTAVAAGLADELRRPAVVAEWRRLADAGLLPQREAAGGALAGRAVVFTGTLASMTREVARQRVRAAGGRVQEAVTRETHLLVAGEGAGRKLEEARRLGVTVLGEEEFRRLLGEAR